MEEYIICFYKDFILLTNEVHEDSFKEGQLIKVNEDEMFKWLELSHSNRGVAIVIYKARVVCDLS